MSSIPNNPAQFEQFIAQLFEQKGYTIKRRGRVNQPDGGVDIEARRRKEYILIQCKAYGHTSRVGVREVRELVGVMQIEQATKGIIVTTGRYTPNALKWAKQAHTQSINIALADKNDIERWAKQRWYHSYQNRAKRFMKLNPMSFFMPSNDEAHVSIVSERQHKETNPTTGKIQTHQFIRTVLIQRDSPNLRCNITITENILKKECRISIQSTGNPSGNLEQIKLAATFYAQVHREVSKIVKKRGFKLIS